MSQFYLSVRHAFKKIWVDYSQSCVNTWYPHTKGEMHQNHESKEADCSYESYKGKTVPVFISMLPRIHQSTCHYSLNTCQINEYLSVCIAEATRQKCAQKDKNTVASFMWLNLILEPKCQSKLNISKKYSVTHQDHAELVLKIKGKSLVRILRSVTL